VVVALQWFHWMPVSLYWLLFFPVSLMLGVVLSPDCWVCYTVCVVVSFVPSLLLA
jgi:hypothetical protein